MKLTNILLSLVTFTVIGALATYALDYTNVYDFSNIWENARADLILPSSTATTFAIIGLKFFSGMFLNNQNANNEKVIKVLNEIKILQDEIIQQNNTQHEFNKVSAQKNINSKLIGDVVTNLSKEWLEEFDKVVEVTEEKRERFDI